jgi:hypothetical protein
MLWQVHQHAFAIVLLSAVWAVADWSAADEVAADDLAAAIDRQIEAWRPTDEERRVDQIGWAADIRTALRLGKEHRRPVFLFTHDGRLGTGRQ